MKKIAKPIIELSNICRSDKKCSIERLDLSVPDGDSFAVVYTSPGSISLLLDILSGKVQPKKGKIFFKGDEITGTKNNFGVIKKDAPIPKRKTVADYAAVPETLTKYWIILGIMVLVFALAAVIALEFIDRDKR